MDKKSEKAMDGILDCLQGFEALDALMVLGGAFTSVFCYLAREAKTDEFDTLKEFQFSMMSELSSAISSELDAIRADKSRNVS